MGKARISMKSIKSVLHMFFADKRSIRKISAITGINYSTICNYIKLVAIRGLSWPKIESMSEEDLENELFLKDTQRPLPDFEYIENELKRAGVTLQLLWLEYKESHPDGYQYSHFCKTYEEWCKKNNVYTPIPHKAGEELYVDYSGDKMVFICLETNQPIEAEIFVAALGASNRIYCEASRSQKLSFWIESNINAFQYNGGVTSLVIPDNLKSAVTTPDRYEASINRTYADMGKHYGTFIVPARSVRPKDKSKVEQAVQSVQREIIAHLRNQTFFGLAELNKSIWERLEILNNRPFQKRIGSRQSCYEEIDKPALKPLPEIRYTYRDWFAKIIVGQDHHILVDRHSYSTPYRYVRTEVEAAADTKIVEIFYKGEVIARHCRSFIAGGRTTLREHMSPKYQHYFDSYDKEKLLSKAKEIGPNVFTWSEKILSIKGQPEETRFRSVQGALSLSMNFEKDRLDAICARALILKINSYKALKSMLVKGADNLPLPIQGTIESHLPQQHDNVRGAEYYS